MPSRIFHFASRMRPVIALTLHNYCRRHDHDANDGLQECMTDIAFVVRSVGSKLDGQRPLKHVDEYLNRMHHPLGDSSWLSARLRRALGSASKDMTGAPLHCFCIRRYPSRRDSVLACGAWLCCARRTVDRLV